MRQNPLTIEDLSDHEKSHSTLENEESLLEKEEIE